MLLSLRVPLGLDKILFKVLSTSSTGKGLEFPSGPYIVWMEDGEGDSLHLNDKKNEQVITGTIDLFTKDEYDQLIDDIQNALSEADISFILNSVQYEEETEFIHYEWRFEI